MSTAAATGAADNQETCARFSGIPGTSNDTNRGCIHSKHALPQLNQQEHLMTLTAAIRTTLAASFFSAALITGAGTLGIGPAQAFGNLTATLELASASDTHVHAGGVVCGFESESSEHRAQLRSIFHGFDDDVNPPIMPIASPAV